MVHLRIVSPAERTGAVLATLEREPAACNIVLVEGAARHPAGDLVLVDVAREDASVVIADLKEHGLEDDGSIAIELTERVVSARAERAVQAARGDEADAVVWEEVEGRTSESAELSGAFVVFMVIAASLAACGVLLDSEILIVGSMVVGPEFGPLAGVCVAAVQRRRGLALKSLKALGVGFALAIAAAAVLATGIELAGLTPDGFSFDEGVAGLVSSPDAFTLIVALCAGTAGMLSLTTAKSGALIGVLISVTTIPAAGEIGVAVAQRDAGAATGSAAQLVINLVAIVVAGIATLVVQRLLFERRERRHDAELAAAAAPADR